MSSRLKSLVFFLIIASTAGLLVRSIFIEDFRISSVSMTPSLFVGDLVFVSKARYNLRFPFSSYELLHFSRPPLSDVVAFSLPDHGMETFVKRVVAGEGDRVEMHGGKLILNGEPSQYRLDEAQDPTDTSGKLYYETTGNRPPRVVRLDEQSAEDYGPIDIPPGYFFALGDNRMDSIDSRAWGPVPYACLKGKVELVWLSVDARGGVRKNRKGVWVQ